MTPEEKDAFFQLLENSTECICSGLVADDYSVAYAGYNFVVIIVLIPVVAVFGLCSNVVNIFIYTRRALLSSGNTYLLALACSDVFVIICGFAVFWFDSARSYISSLEDIVNTLMSTLAVGYIAQTCSVYFTVFAAVDCYVKVCWRSAIRCWCSVRRARQVVGLVFLVCAAYSSLRFGQFRLRDCIPDDANETVVEVCPTRLYMQINTVYNVYMYMILMAFFPFIMLSILNALIVSKVNKERAAFRTSLVELNGISTSAAMGHDVLKSPTRQVAVQSESEVSSNETITMIMVVVLFLGCNTLALVVNIVETFWAPSPLVLNFMTDTSNFLVIFNSSVNFVVYIIFADDYRAHFMATFCGADDKAPPCPRPPSAEPPPMPNGTFGTKSSTVPERELLRGGGKFRCSVSGLSDVSSPLSAPPKSQRLQLRDVGGESGSPLLSSYSSLNSTAPGLPLTTSL